MSGELRSGDLTSDLTTWSEYTEATDATSEADRWREFRIKCEPLLLIARMSTPFIDGKEKAPFGVKFIAGKTNVGRFCGGRGG